MHGKVLALFLTAAIAPTITNGSAQSDDKSKWSLKDAHKVVGRAITQAPSGIMAITHDVRYPRLRAIWLTDDVCWAISHIIQYEVRRTDKEAKEIYEDCRVDAADSYSIYLSASETVYREVPNEVRCGASNMVRTKAESTPAAVNRRLDQIFLKRRDNRHVFVRPTKIDRPPEYFSYIHGVIRETRSEHFDIDRDVIITFPRSVEHVKGAKDIEIEMNQGKRQLRLKFKLKNLRADKGRLENL